MLDSRDAPRSFGQFSWAPLGDAPTGHKGFGQSAVIVGSGVADELSSRPGSVLSASPSFELIPDVGRHAARSAGALGAETAAEQMGALGAPDESIYSSIAPPCSTATGSRRAPLPILLPDKLDWVQTAHMRSPANKSLSINQLLGNGSGMVKGAPGTASVPILGGSALFLPEGSTLGSLQSMNAMARSRSEQHLLPRAAPSSIAMGASRGRPGTTGQPDKWSLYSFDRIAAHFSS